MREEILVDAGPVGVQHRLALAVEAVDATTGTPVSGPLRVSREDVRGRGPDFVDHGGGRFVLSHARALPEDAVIRIDDPTRRHVPRRLVVRLWPLPRLVGADRIPPTAVFVPGRARLLRPWLLPGSAAVLPRGTTGLRTRVVHAGAPVRWARVELFTVGGRLGWGHGDERGEVVVVATERSAYPAMGTVDFPVAIRVHRSAAPPALDQRDPLADLVVQRIFRSVVPPSPVNLLNDRLRGIGLPPPFVTDPDQVVTLRSGRVTVLPDVSV